jgi:hypothetical protein
MNTLVNMITEPMHNVSRKSQIVRYKRKTLGRKTLGRKTLGRKLLTGVPGRGKFIKGWKGQKPGYHDRTVMMKRCGQKCFLGPNKSFPICSRGTCKRNKKGIYAAYIRAEEYKTLRNKDKYRRISAKARRMLGKKKFLH